MKIIFDESVANRKAKELANEMAEYDECCKKYNRAETHLWNTWTVLAIATVILVVLILKERCSQNLLWIAGFLHFCMVCIHISIADPATSMSLPNPDITLEYWNFVKDKTVLEVIAESVDLSPSIRRIEVKAADSSGIVHEKYIGCAKVAVSLKHQEETLDLNTGTFYVPYRAGE